MPRHLRIIRSNPISEEWPASRYLISGYHVHVQPGHRCIPLSLYHVSAGSACSAVDLSEMTLLFSTFASLQQQPSPPRSYTVFLSQTETMPPADNERLPCRLLVALPTTAEEPTICILQLHSSERINQQGHCMDPDAALGGEDEVASALRWWGPSLV
jgi:hypothetical protein